MSINLTQRAAPYATYIPSMQIHSAERIVGQDAKLRLGTLPAGLTAHDFNFLNPENRFWHYDYALATAAHFKGRKNDNAINTRYPSNEIVADSGGYQIGHGSMGGLSKWNEYTDDAEKIMELWRDSHDLIDDIYKWQGENSTLAMTLDMPLWAIGNVNSPFHKLSAEQLTTLSVENLERLVANRHSWGRTKYLNVLQGNDTEEEENWFQAVKKFKLEGWSLAGNVGQMGGINRVLRRILLLRDENLLASPMDVIHILRLSRVRWAPVMTAVQRAVRKSTSNENFKITYDSSSPYRIGGVTSSYAVLNSFGKNLNKDWSIKSVKFPADRGYANAKKRIPLKKAYGEHLPHPLNSPIAELLTVQDLNINKGDHAVRTFDGFSDEVLINHNVYIYCLANILANEAVFDTNPTAPQEIIDAVGMIDDLFMSQNWQRDLGKMTKLLANVVGDGKTDYPVMQE